MNCEIDHSTVTGKFCTSCGEKISEKISTPKCSQGHELDLSLNFCTECGEAVSESKRTLKKPKIEANSSSLSSSVYVNNVSAPTSPSSESSAYQDIPSPVIKPERPSKLVLGIVASIIGLIALIGLAGGTSVSKTTVTVELTIKGEDNCFNLSWGYSDIPGAQVLLTKDGEQVGFGNYNSIGNSSILGCTFTATIPDVPMDGESYGVSMASGRRGSIYNTKAELIDSDWTFSLSLGNY